MDRRGAESKGVPGWRRMCDPNRTRVETTFGGRALDCSFVGRQPSGAGIDQNRSIAVNEAESPGARTNRGSGLA
jgi:hypothetical protein